MKKIFGSYKNIFKTLFSPIISLTRYIVNNSFEAIKIDPVTTVVRNRAIHSSADYIEKNISKALLFEQKERLWDFALSKITIDGLNIEFGVFSGYSINYFSKKISHKTFYGFDSFEGLREDWIGTSAPKGEFNLNGILPKVNSNVSLVKGWFDESLPDFLKVNTDNLSFIHFDADTYQSTVTLLNLIGDRIVKGTVIVFDEYLGHPNWQNNEYLAWKEFVEEKKMNYQYIGFSIQQTAIKII